MEYLVGLAVDPAGPQIIIVSASRSLWEAHSRGVGANSLVYRRSGEADGGEWEAISKGLLEPSGTIISVLAANPNAAGIFYAINNRGIFFSTDSGSSWDSLDIPWNRNMSHNIPWR